MKIEDIKKQALEELDKELFKIEVEKYKKKLLAQRKGSFLYRLFPWKITLTITKGEC